MTKRPDVPSLPAGQDKLQAVQALRFFAALLVVLDHALYSMHKLYGISAPVEVDGRFGVEIFFIISGFIMVTISSDGLGWKTGPTSFLINRFTRVAPVYWVAAISYALLIGLASRFGKAGAAPAWEFHHFLFSAFFIPYRDQFSNIQPVLPQGWTLNFELYFYVLFALCLTRRYQTGLRMLLVGLPALALAGQLLNRVLGDQLNITHDISAFPFLVPLRFWTHPLILLFAVGAVIALWRLSFATAPRRQVEVPYATALMAALVLAGVAAQNAASLSFGGRTLIVALASVATVVVAVFASRSGDAHPLSRTLSRLGDASYSMYLFHFHVIWSVTFLWKRLPLTASTSWLYLVVATAASVAASLLVYSRIELPVTRFFRDLLSRYRTGAS